MTKEDIIARRLVNQKLIDSSLSSPHEVVKWLVAMQAQEYAMAKWAIGLRLPGSKESDIEHAFNNGTILRTHLMRPTWHFVAPEDIRWLLKLTAPRVHAINAYMYRQCELDKKLLNRCNDQLIKILAGGKHLTRKEINVQFMKKKILADGPRLSYIMMHAELEGILCSGPRKGKQFTYALLDERVPKVKSIHRDEALAQFTSRYFTSRGPATIQDFVSWSGLTVKDAKEGVNTLSKDFIKESLNGQDYWYSAKSANIESVDPKGITFLLPDYDEYGMSYKDRSALLPPGKPIFEIETESSTRSHWLIVDGVAGGKWNYTIQKGTPNVDFTLFQSTPLNKKKQVEQVVKRYVKFFDIG